MIDLAVFYRRADAVAIALGKLGYRVGYAVHLPGTFVLVPEGPEFGGLLGKRFCLHVGAAAIAEGLLWGGFDGLSAHQHAELRCALVRGEFDRAMSMKLGSDPARCEIVD